MDRWTMRELKETDDISFAICILNERKKGLTPYSPLGIKIGEAVSTLSALKQETDNYLNRVSGICTKTKQNEDITDLSDCPDEMKEQIIINAEKLNENGGMDDESD